MMKYDKIIISGPPGSGKTTIINELINNGYLCFNEINPQEIKDNKTKNDKKLLSEFLFNQRKKQHDKIINTTAFYDRSLIDVIAYLDYWNEIYPTSWDQIITECQYARKVFFTPCWVDIYKKNKRRPESYSEAEKIEFFIKKTYLKFNYQIIEVPKKDINQRIEFILKNI